VQYAEQIRPDMFPLSLPAFDISHDNFFSVQRHVWCYVEFSSKKKSVVSYSTIGSLGESQRPLYNYNRRIWRFFTM